jgi:hypothetical protein
VAAGLGFLSVVVMPLGVGCFIWEQLPPPKDVTVFASAFGDVVGPLFAALAFAGLIYTALMQREELSLQREELRETRAVLERTANAQTAQVDTAKQAAKLSALAALFTDTSRSAQFLGPRYIGSEEGKEMLESLSKLRGQIEAVLLDLGSDSKRLIFRGCAGAVARGRFKPIKKDCAHKHTALQAELSARSE